MKYYKITVKSVEYGGIHELATIAATDQQAGINLFKIIYDFQTPCEVFADSLKEITIEEFIEIVSQPVNIEG